VIEIAGGIILAVLFFVFLPHILAFGLLSAATLVLLILLFLGALFAWIAPLPAVVIASVIFLPIFYTRFVRKSAFAKHEIESRLDKILQRDENLAKRIIKEGWRGKLDLNLKRGFTLKMSVSENKNLERLTSSDISLKVYRLGEAGALCSFSATKNEFGTVNWTFAPLRNVDTYTLTSLQVALDEYIQECQSDVTSKTSEKNLAPYSPLSKKSV
jgi:hypothetical protein